MSWWRKIFGAKGAKQPEKPAPGAACRRKYQNFRELTAATASAWQQWQALQPAITTPVAAEPPQLWEAFCHHLAAVLDRLADFSLSSVAELQEAATRLTATWPPPVPADPAEALPDFKPPGAEGDSGSLTDIPALLRAIDARRLAEMFCLSLRVEVSKREAASLVTGRLVPILVVDLDGGLSRMAATVGLEDLASKPFRALLTGMLSIPWPKARPVDLKGFMSVVGVTSTTPRAEDQLKKISLALVARDYLNFSLCLGYHASTIEAFFAPWPEQNYLRFHYEGGAASVERRIRRLRLIEGVLSRLGFVITIAADRLDAQYHHREQERLALLLEVLGRLEVYTKQLDMVMTDDQVVYGYIEDFLGKHCPAQLYSQL